MMEGYKRYRSYGHTRFDSFILGVPAWAVIGVTCFIGICVSLWLML